MAKQNDAVSDPFGYLKDDHKKVAKLLGELEETTERAEKTREEVFEEIDNGLSLHAAVEEKVVYPILEELKKTHDVVLESLEEHHVVKILLGELEHLSPTTEEWTAKLKVLQENVEHHVEEEEKEGGMFDKAEKALSKEQKEDMRKKMEAFLASPTA